MSNFMGLEPQYYWFYPCGCPKRLRSEIFNVDEHVVHRCCLCGATWDHGDYLFYILFESQNGDACTFEETIAQAFFNGESARSLSRRFKVSLPMIEHAIRMNLTIVRPALDAA